MLLEQGDVNEGMSLVTGGKKPEAARQEPMWELVGHGETSAFVLNKVGPLESFEQKSNVI